MNEELTLKILRDIAEPGSGHLFSRREAARSAVEIIESSNRRIHDLEASMHEILTKTNNPNREFYLKHSLKYHIANRLSLTIFRLIAEYGDKTISLKALFDRIDDAVNEHIQYAREVTESPKGWLLEVMELPLP